MQLTRSVVGLLLFGLLWAGWFRAFAHEEQVILVGRTAAGEIVVDTDFLQPVELPASVFPGITGYAGGELAFHSAIIDEPKHDFFQLVTTADFRFVLLAKDSGLEVWNDTASGFMATNETFFIGAPIFDAHPIWNIVNGTQGSSYSLTLQLRDLNGVYPDSAPFVISFTPLIIPPRIDFRKIDAQHAMLSWPTNVGGWELQQSASGSANSWRVVTNTPITVTTNFVVSISTTEQQQFFRLRKL
ncbi:MAG: hypothetical protein QM813_22295 [Verrucomicrobiota bacterium]